MQKQLIKIILSGIVALYILTTPAIAQVAVERSKDKVVISGKTYYIHFVKKGETAYSISKAYGLSVEELAKENPLIVNGLKTGQSLIIPFIENTGQPEPPRPVNLNPERDETKYIYHKLSPGETVYFLSRKYGVSEDEILQSNPGVEINKMSVGSEIAIPKREFMNNVQKFSAQDTNIYYHKVVKGETLYSIARKYKTTVRELRKENRGLFFAKVDEFIRIPLKKKGLAVENIQAKPDTLKAVAEEPLVSPERIAGFTPVGDLRGRYNVALLLPLYLAENSNRREIDSSQVIKGKPVYKVIKRPDQWIYAGTVPFLELYEGILLAADTLRAHGLDINLYVYDIRSDTIGTDAQHQQQGNQVEKRQTLTQP